jgi:hypothetical protein
MPQSESTNHASGGTSPFPLIIFCFWLMAFTGLPMAAWGHGYEFLSARLDLREEGSLIELKITAAYGANPMLPNATAAITDLSETLHIQHHGKARLLTDLAPIHYEQSGSSEGTLPASLLHADDRLDHQFMIAHWRWVPDVAEIAFTVPKGSKHDVLLWREPSGEATESILLLSGDVSKSIPVNPTPEHWVVMALMLVTALLIISFFRFRGRTH